MLPPEPAPAPPLAAPKEGAKHDAHEQKDLQTENGARDAPRVHGEKGQDRDRGHKEADDRRGQIQEGHKGAIGHGHEAAAKEAAPPPPPKDPGAPTQLAPMPAPDGPAAPAATVADAIAAIAAAPSPGPTAQSSDPSDMMRLGAGARNAHAKTASGALALAPIVGTFRGDEVLGHHLSAEVLHQLSTTQKYRIEVGHAASVTRLILPGYLNANEELAALQARFPDQIFGLNYVYASYRGAGERDTGPPLPSGNAPGCDAARCYGPAMIGWHSELAACARNVVVGIIDTGLDGKHPALKRLHLIQHPADADRRGQNWHGTGVAALLGGSWESSTPGLIPDAQYVVVDAFYSSNGGGKAEGPKEQTITDTDHLLWALETLQQKRAEVVNMSLVGPSDPAIHAEIRKMARHGVVFVAAAGNGGPAGAAAFPAAYAEVIAVTAVDRNKHGYVEANQGGYIDVAAPGVRVWTALPGDAQGFLSGTSFAAPFVTAIAAATYNSTPMKAAARDQEHAFNPKDEVIGRMAVEKLGDGPPGSRNGVFGLGLARAPVNCSPPMDSQPRVAQRPEPAPTVLAAGTPGWQTQVHQASSSP